MSFLTKPTVVKGEPASFTLVKSQLISFVPKVSSDAFFSDSTNWKRISVLYKNAQEQEEVLVFDASEELPTSTFSVTDKARSDYQITRIIIKDLDDGTLVIARSDLSTEVLSMLDVSFQAVLETIYYTYDIVTSNILVAPQGGNLLINENDALLINESDTGVIQRSVPLVGDFDVSFVFSGAVTGNDSYFALHDSLNEASTQIQAAFRFYNGTAYTYFDNGQQDTVSNLSSGNTYRIKRTGIIVEYYANGVKTPSNSSFSGDAYFFIRTHDTFSLNITQAASV